MDDPINGDVIDATDADTVNDTVEAIQTKLGSGVAARGLNGVPQLSGTVVRTSRSFAYKGPIYTPSFDQTIIGFRTILQSPAVSSTVKAALVTVTAGSIATIVNSADTLTVHASAPASSPIVDLLFASPQTLTAGTVYGLLVGYSSTAGGVGTTTDFPVFTIVIASQQLVVPRPGTFSSSVYHVASNGPIVSTAVTTATNDQSSGACTYAVLPIMI
ncbi:MAG: hypothetical protein M3N43_06485 [Actinomycetota bacterium]|nr:hypothetical protein [Actinomycetota bacterium]